MTRISRKVVTDTQLSRLLIYTFYTNHLVTDRSYLSNVQITELKRYCIIVFECTDCKRISSNNGNPSYTHKHT